MSIKTDKLVIIDLEATCWEGYNAPIGQENEIIEVGVCLLDLHSLEISHKRSLLVRPTRSVVSPFCTALTTITQELVDREGTDFQTACEVLEKDYQSQQRAWASWGQFDNTLFSKQCKSRHVRYPFAKPYANIKRVFQDSQGTRLGLSPALESIGLSLEGTHHRGHDDAYNIARVLAYLIEKHGLGILKRYRIGI